MAHPRRVYLLSPKEFSPETIAVTFAKTSRSPKPFDEIAAELTNERSAKFHEKWVVGYGHASVAEHAVLHVAFENVSRLAIETIEGNRLASYTEKSTRYQKWQHDSFYIPDELLDDPLRDDFINTCQTLFQAYETCIPRVISWLNSHIPQETGETQKAYQRRLRTPAVDNCRFLLPAASLANVGMTINARALEYAICKMLSSPLEEVRQIGESLKKVGEQETPTLIKYASCNAYLVSAREKLRYAVQALPQEDQRSDSRLIAWDEHGEDRILAALLYRFAAGATYSDCAKIVRGMTHEEKAGLVRNVMADRGKFDQPLREFEHAHMTWDMLMDQGAYFEFKRHRMMTQTVQPLTSDYSFAVPRAISASGCEELYVKAMQSAANTFRKMADWNPDAAGYVIPNGFNRRVLFTMNLREAFHFCRLRAAESAHFSIRRVALQAAETIRKLYPLFGNYMDVQQTPTSQEIADEFFTHLRK